jgi:hypothetical protein
VSFLSFLSFQPCRATYWKDRKDREDKKILFYVSPAGSNCSKKSTLQKSVILRGNPSQLAMDNSRELASLLRRANRVAILQAPPVLSMVMLQPGDELPPPSPWCLTLAVEPRRVITSSALEVAD